MTTSSNDNAQTAPKPVDPETIRQLSSSPVLQAASSRPLLVCDVDEVILHLVEPIKTIIAEHGYTMDAQVLRLTGNVRHAETGEAASQEKVWEFLDIIFAEQEQRQKVVDGAIDAITALSQEMEVLFLTNMPHHHRDVRTRYLSELGFGKDVVTNTGAKGPVLSHISSLHDGEIAFIDDTVQNLVSVANCAPHVQLFHFMADDMFRNLVQLDLDHHISTGDWAAATNKVQSVMLGTSDGNA